MLQKLKKIFSETEGIWLSLLGVAVVILITIVIFFAGNQLAKNIEKQEKTVECRVDKLYTTVDNRLFFGNIIRYYVVLTDKAEKSYVFRIFSEDYHLLEVGKEISLKQKTTTLGEKIFSTAFYWGENSFELIEEITDKVEQEETIKDTAITEATPGNISEAEK